ncbi:hypothetical protein N7522_003944 [Penicillium canescens]|nr:uncharacterized protein N7446_003837 [Penicillium canescens]KAJ6008928.1 hypothetical protein N7522_003944 [Penicillium canescens]KAJ6040847.1 hypothetical protein N7444_009752 [Penicillium canescens]KAJ6066800.1 hypothetical protein N7446_003837 [Penicillium canescens]
MGSSTAVQASTKTDTAPKHKAARMEEWLQLPLREWPDMERWMTVMSDQFSIEQPRERIPDTSRGGYAIPVTPIDDDETRTSGVSDELYSGTNPHGWQPGGSRISTGSLYDAHQPRPRMITSPAYYGQQVAVEPEVLPSPSAGRIRHEVDDAVGVSVVDHANAGAVVESRSTRAEELSHNYPSLYF